MPQELDPTLVWSPPVEEVYVAAEERLEPRDKKPYRRGITKLPKLKTWAFRDVVLVPAGKSMFKYGDPRRKPTREYPNILGGIIRKHFHWDCQSPYWWPRRGLDLEALRLRGRS
nr:uncharacterized protein LOC127303955 [Lolium perenne]